MCQYMLHKHVQRKRCLVNRSNEIVNEKQLVRHMSVMSYTIFISMLGLITK